MGRKLAREKFRKSTKICREILKEAIE